MKSEIYIFLSILLIVYGHVNQHPGFSISISSNDTSVYPASREIETKITTPPLKHVDFSEYYFQNLHKTYVLEDGREVTCRIPLYEIEDEPEISSTRNITDDEARVLLANLRDSCARMRTPEFLWEFCFDKYARQYDDQLTFINAAKQKYELYFLGFENNMKKVEYSLLINDRTGDFTPAPKYSDVKSSFEIPEYRYAYITGHQLKLVNVRSSVMEYNDYFITFWVPRRLVTNDTIIENRMKFKSFVETKTVDKIKKIKNMEEYIKINRKAQDVVINNIIILNEPFPVDVVVDDITIEELPKKNVRADDSFYGNIHRNFVYGAAFSFLTMVKEGNTVILVFNKTVQFERTVMRIHSDFVLEVDKEIPDIDKKNYVLTDIFIVVAGGPEAKDIAWEMKKGNITIFGNIVVGDKSANFTKEFKKGDIFRVVTSHRPFKVFLSEVLEVINDRTLKLREPKTQAIYKKKLKEYLVGKYRDWDDHKKKFLKPRELYIGPNLDNINYRVPPHIVVLYNFEDYSMNVTSESLFFKDPKNWLLQFKYFELHHDSSLMFLFKEKYSDEHGITVHFLENRRLIIKRSDDYSSFKSFTLGIDINGTEQHFDKNEIWIIYENGNLRVGLTNIISAQTQLISFNVDKKLGFFDLLTKFTYNLYIADINIITPPPQLKYAIETMELKHKNTSEDIRYFQEWGLGTSCGSGLSRSSTIEFKCSDKGSFMEIEKLTEPSMCKYHIVIGTIYMCPKREKMGNKDIIDYSSKISCFV